MVFRYAGFILALSMSATAALALDLHDYWDRRCAECHGHAGPFARQFLSARDGKLQGRHHVNDLAVFLRNHYLAADLVEPMSAMLLAQVTIEPRFRSECGRCHQNAATLVREVLTLRDGVLVSRATGRPAAAFLSSHARIKPEDVPFFVDVLTRVTREVEGR